MAGKGKGLAIGKKTDIVENPVTGNDDDNVIDQSSSGAANRINGGDGNDNIVGTGFADRVNAGDGDDTVMGGAGDDVLFGNDGKDTAAYEGSIFNFLWEEGKGNSLTVTDSTGAEGIDTLKHFECLKFDDYTFDLTGPNAALILADDQGTDEDNSTAFSFEAWDFDGGSPSIASISVTGGGTVSASASGALAQGMGTGTSFDVSYDPNGAYETLAVGQSTTETISIVVDDGQGNLSSKDIVVTIDGVNDDPTLAAAATNATEDGASVDVDLSALGEDIDSDDDGSTLTYSISGTPAEGVASISGTTFTFDSGADFQNLAVGETRDVVVEVTATDAHGATAVNTVTVTVTGTNDAPTLSAAATNAVEDGSSVDVDLTALGADVDSDDDGSTLSYSVSGNPSEGSASINGTTLTFGPGSDFQNLALGETRDVTIQVTAEDSHGATATNDVTVTVTGTNDAPTLAAALAGAVEDGPSVDVDLSALGADVDSDNDGSNLSYSITSGPSEGAASINGTTLTFNPGNNFQDLADGETRIVNVQVTAEDAHGATATNDVTITVTGTNDAPTLAAAAISAVEDGSSVDVDLAALGADVDSDDDGSTLSYSVSGNPSEGSASINGTTLTFDPGADFQDLAVGETREVVVEVTTTDAHGATAVNTVTVTVTGTNDAPTASGSSGSVTEDATVTANGSIAVIDADTSDSHSFSVQGGGNGTYGSLAVDGNGDWTYNLNNGAANVQVLNTGDQVFDNFVVNIDDGNGGTTVSNVTITVNGDDDNIAPVANDDNISATVQEYLGYYEVNDGPNWWNNPETYSGVEAAALVFGGSEDDYAISTNSSQDPNTITNTAWYDGWGEHSGMQFADTYELDVNGDGYQNPGGGNTARSAYVRDGLSDAYKNYVWRVVEGVDTDEDTLMLIEGSKLLANDLDADGDVLSISSVSATSANGAAVSLDINGNITYDPTVAAALQALNDGEVATDSFTYTVSDGNGGFDSATVSLEVNGADEPATILTFDDITTGNYAGVPNGYGGLNWSGANILNSTNYRIQDSGYIRGNTSGEYVVYASGTLTVSDPVDEFDFVGVTLTAAWNDNLNIEIIGYNNGAQLHSQTIVVSDDFPTDFTFGWQDLDQVTFRPFGGTDAGTPGGGNHLAMDDFIFG